MCSIAYWTQYLCVLACVCVRDILPFLAGVCVELFPDVIQRDWWGFHLAFTVSHLTVCVSLTVVGIYPFLTPFLHPQNTRTHTDFLLLLFLYWGNNFLHLHICENIHDNMSTYKQIHPSCQTVYDRTILSKPRLIISAHIRNQ